MYKNEHILSVDIKRKVATYTVIPTFVQYDNVALIFKVFYDGKQTNLEGFTKAEVTHKRRDGKIIIGEARIATLDNGEQAIIYKYSGNELAIVGYNETILTIYFNDSKVSIQSFNVKVVADNRDILIQSAQKEVGALRQLMDDVEENSNTAITSLETVTKATQEFTQLKEDTKFVGEYSPTVEYKTNNIVAFNGSSFIAKKNTLGIAPPTLPTIENDSWGLTSRKGADGNGVAVFHYQEFTSTANQTQFTLSNTYDVGANKTTVTVGGVPQYAPSNYVESSNRTITFTEPLPAGLLVTIRYQHN